MAKELDTAKSSPAKAVDKSTKDAKSTKDKAAKNGKKKKGIKKYFKDAKSEFKKVIWPTPKETTKNTIVVLIMCILAGLVIFGLDSLFGLLNKLAFH